MGMTDVIEVKLVRTNVFTRWDCTVCDGRTEKDAVLCESENMAVRVCPQCLKENDIDGRLEKTAAGLEHEASHYPAFGHCEMSVAATALRNAAFMRSLIGRLRVPTYEQWETAENRVWDDAEAYSAEQRDDHVDDGPFEWPDDEPF